MKETRIRLEPWSAADFPLLERTNEPAMTRHLGGPESAEQLRDRQHRYEALSAREPSAGRMFRVVLEATGESVGSIGFWERQWRREPVYEAGWGILPEFQGRGLAVAALTELLAHVRAHGNRADLHAFPGTDHRASNAVCRRAGFVCLGEVDFEYPPGVPHPSLDWRHRVGPQTPAPAPVTTPTPVTAPVTTPVTAPALAPAPVTPSG
ncbi:GNAT family N-acetyltransferase [Streptomyces yangpuensis]|uniref:GNAT family N-acetyltransferase n=1 Tax=Streptomyces yangpuensis TaxID=1648182 RepID=UPI003654B06B